MRQGAARAGAGDRRRDSNSTKEAINFTRHAKRSAATRCAALTGYYNKPTQDGLYRHFMAITDAVDIPIVIYNVPARTIVEISRSRPWRAAPSTRTSSASRMPPPM